MVIKGDFVDTCNVDVAVIGAGSAGLNARKQVLKEGKRVVLIESGPYGTTCARVGCMPSKLLIAAADVAHEIDAAHRFGIHGERRIDGQAVMDRVRRERDRFVGFVVEGTQSIPQQERLCGHARFVGPTTLEVGDHTRVEARSVVVAAGSTPYLPPPFDAIADQVMVNDDVFEMTQLPASIAVIGTGIIGLELGQALRRLDVNVSFFNRSERLGQFQDPEIKRVVRAVLDRELDLNLDVEILSATPRGSEIVLRWRDAAEEDHEKCFERVLVAAGRTANLVGLNLQSTGVELDQRGRPHWDPQTTQCAGAPIFMAGDISGHRALLHEAADEGRIAGANAARFPDVSAHIRRTALAVAFTDPQMGVVGQSYDQLDLDEVEIGKVSYDDQGRARVMGQNRGLVRLYADRKCCRLIGAEMFGPRVEHLAHLLAWSIQQELTVQGALQMPFYHPVLEEGLRTALRDLARKLKVSGECRCEDMADAPGT